MSFGSIFDIREPGDWRGDRPAYEAVGTTDGKVGNEIARRELPTHMARRHKTGRTRPTGGRAKPNRVRTGM